MKNTNTYILPEGRKTRRIFLLIMLQAIMRTIFNNNFHCKRMLLIGLLTGTDEGQSSMRNEGDIGL